jgi:hypothetical protein
MMSQQGPILVVSHAGRPSFAAILDEADLFPVIESGWTDAAQAIAQVNPAAVIADAKQVDHAQFAVLAKHVAAQEPYLPMIAVDPDAPLPQNAIPFTCLQRDADRLIARLRAALRVRALDTTLQRRLETEPFPDGSHDIDPFSNATALLVGRGGTYPALSVALGECLGVVGALSIEAAANHLNTRDIDGIVLGEGFTGRVIEAFLTVLSEDARFRNLPVILTSGEPVPAYDLPNLEVVSGEPAHVASSALPLIRQHALEAQLSRSLRAIDAGGLLDPHTGLLTRAAFDREFASAVAQTLSNGGGLSVARFSFDPENPRAQLDGARIISRLMRQMDFGAVQDDGSVIAAFAATDLRAVHAIARRLSSVMRHTLQGKRGTRTDPAVSVATLTPQDSPNSLLMRLCGEGHRAAS